MKINFSTLLVVGKISLASLLLSSIYSCGNEKPQAVEATTADQGAQDTTAVQLAITGPVVYSQRYDGSIPY